MTNEIKPKKKKINILFGLDALVNRTPKEDMTFLELRKMPLPFKFRAMFFGGRA